MKFAKFFNRLYKLTTSYLSVILQNLSYIDNQMEIFCFWSKIGVIYCWNSFLVVYFIPYKWAFCIVTSDLIQICAYNFFNDRYLSFKFIF